MVRPAGLGRDEWGCWHPSCQERAASVRLWVGRGAGRGYRCHWGPASSLVSALSSHRCSPWPAWQDQVGSASTSPVRYLLGSECPAQRVQPRVQASPLPGPLHIRSVEAWGQKGEGLAPSILRVKQVLPPGRSSRRGASCPSVLPGQCLLLEVCMQGWLWKATGKHACIWELWFGCLGHLRIYLAYNLLQNQAFGF